MAHRRGQVRALMQSLEGERRAYDGQHAIELDLAVAQEHGRVHVCVGRPAHADEQPQYLRGQRQRDRRNRTLAGAAEDTRTHGQREEDRLRRHLERELIRERVRKGVVFPPYCPFSRHRVCKQEQPQLGREIRLLCEATLHKVIDPGRIRLAHRAAEERAAWGALNLAHREAIQTKDPFAHAVDGLPRQRLEWKRLL